MDVEITTGVPGDNNEDSTPSSGGDGDNGGNDATSEEVFSIRNILIGTSIIVTASVGIAGIGYRYIMHRKNKGKLDNTISKDDLEDVVHKVMMNSATIGRASSTGSSSSARPTPSNLESGLSDPLSDSEHLNFDDLMNHSFTNNSLDSPEDFHFTDPEISHPSGDDGWTSADAKSTDVVPPERRGRASTEIDVENLFKVNLDRD